VGVALGLAMAFVFGVVSWNRMERLHDEAAAPTGRPGGT